MKTEERLELIRTALKSAFDVDYEVSVRKDHAFGFVADAHADKSKKLADGEDYFFSYGSTKAAAVTGLVNSIEGTIRCRLDKFKVWLRTLLG